ncbi:PH and SEC7 domain-containing protein [Parasteatoda tepidariorum]|nr:PH and SEC7 domain-containing protein isoform X1 [Parasteatoda tepidariorum]XP_042907791.1 PH and SEC7 domain-containing protein isoform X1 [Parasteatoda tepidariorum]XP_042907792.1 PH and SEC7 domain-containing protein isoform X1 [Parasteatoda tepidariorum]XP_042907793.1 PH and SEC7 domain-containing protein isoform X2 [Parasteatoda tepidariorum]
MERCDSHVIIKGSNVKSNSDTLDKLNDESKRCSRYSVPCDSNSQCHNIEYSEDLYCNKRTHTGKNPYNMPNELYISLNSESTQTSKVGTKTNQLEFFASSCRSTPASPEETERVRNKQVKKELPSFHSPTIEKKLPFSYSTSFVRTSKSEDHLQKSSLTTVNIDIEDELASSLDTLLDTKADEFIELDKDECLGNSCPGDVSLGSRNSDEQQNSRKSDLSGSSSDRTGSKASVKVGENKSSRHHPADSLSESSGSEIIPSDSSVTIRGDSEDSGDGECTSEQISAISSLDDVTDLSKATDSDLGSPVESLSPEDIHLDDGWIEADKKENGLDVFQDITNKGKGLHKTNKQVLSNIELNLTCNYSEKNKLQPPTSIFSSDKSPTSFSSSLSVPKVQEEKLDLSDSPTSPGSEGTFADLSYHELTESYDEISSAFEADDVIEPSTKRSESPPTDDESDIESLHSFHYSPKAVDLPSAIRLAKRLYSLDGFKKTDVSRHLSKNNEFSKAVAEEYLKFFDFTKDGLDIALRKFLNQFCLVGETQERERVLVHFSKRYLDCNPNSFKSQDAVHTLTCALMLLNSDLHGENIRHKMVCGEFIENLAELNDGENYPRDVLKTLYHSIKTHPLEWALDEEDDKKISSKVKNSSNDYRQSFVCHNPFLEVPNPTCATEYKKGYVMRKSCIDASGKKTPLGRRSWKMLYATLRDLVLYLHKDEHGFKKNQLYDSLHNSIRIHHAYAEKAVDYTKKQYVFRLHTAEQAVYLFQTSDSKELESWVDTINLVAASLSSPPLPSGVGCQRKFQRPLLPVSHTKLNLREQLQDHENRIVWLEKEYEELVTRTPEKTLKARFAQEFLEKEAHLTNELTRYRTYAYLLRTRMAQHPELETPLVQTSIGEVEEPDPNNSPKAKSKFSISPKSSPVKKSVVASSTITSDCNSVQEK